MYQSMIIMHRHDSLFYKGKVLGIHKLESSSIKAPLWKTVELVGYVLLAVPAT